MATFSDLESQASVRAKINAAITKVDDADAIGNLTARRFDTVTELLAYSATPRLTVGTYVEAGGFRYLVVSTGEHVTTAGADKLTVQPLWVGADGGIFVTSAFGDTGDGSTDDTAAIQAAIDAAYDIVIQVAGGGVSDEDYPQIGGCSVHIPQGDHLITSLQTYGITLFGAGQYATRLVSSFNGKVLYNNVSDGTYDKTGVVIKDLCIKGDRTQSGQCLIDLLRPYWCFIQNVQVYQSGGVGIRVRQGLGGELNAVTAHANVGDGIVLTDGINSWADTTPNNLPTNALMVVNCHGSFNDGAGLRITGAGSGAEVNGCVVSGGAYEYNYLASADNVGYQIHIDCAADVPNVLQDIWVEGPAQAHVYVNCANVATPTKIIRLHHFGNGTAGNVDRAVIVDKGTVYLHGCFGHGEQYKTIAGSKAPFRVNKASGVAVIYNTDAVGSTITDGNFVEDETGALTGLTNFAVQNNFGRSFGNFRHYGGSGEIAFGFYQEGQTQPFVTVVPGTGMGFGSGSVAADAYIGRSAANTIGIRAGDFIDVGGTWNSSHLKMGGYRLWVDGTGDLRIKLGAPASDTDGAVVGTQT